MCNLMTFRTKKKNPQNLACSLNLVTFGTVKKMSYLSSKNSWAIFIWQINLVRLFLLAKEIQ